MVGGSCDPGHHLTHLPDTGTQLRVRGQQVSYKEGENTRTIRATYLRLAE